MEFLSSEISRLLHHYLLKCGYENTANTFISECPDLKSFKPVCQKSVPYKLPRLLGPSLEDYLSDLSGTKDYVIEELENLPQVGFKAQDCLLTHTETLVKYYKELSVVKHSSTCEVSVNTDASLFTESTEPKKKQVCDVSVNTDASGFVEPKQAKETCDASINTEALHGSTGNGSSDLQYEENSCLESDNSPEAINKILDFSVMYDRCLETSALHEKIVEQINQKIFKGSNLSTTEEGLMQSSSNVDSSLSQELESAIKAIVAETVDDPVFEDIIIGCLGGDIDEDPTPMSTPAETPSSTPLHVNEEAASVPISFTENNLPLSLPGNSSQPPVASASHQYSTTNVTHSQIAPNPTNQIQPHQWNNGSVQVPSTLPISSYAILTSANGEMTLIPSVVSAVPSFQTAPEKPKPKPKQKPAPKPNRPVNIAPRPIVIQLPAQPQMDSQVTQAVNEAIGDHQFEFTVTPEDPNAPAIQLQTVTSPRPPSAATRLNSTFSSATKVAPLLHSLMSLVNEESKNESTLCQSGQSGQTEGESSCSSAQSNKLIQKTPKGKSRRNSHIRILDFGESPKVKGHKRSSSKDPAPEGPPTKAKVIPWDSNLRGSLPAEEPPPSAASVFATPKGKAKKARKPSPPPKTQLECAELNADYSPAPDSMTPCEASTPAILRPTSKSVFLPPSDIKADASVLSETAQTPLKDSSTGEHDILNDSESFSLNGTAIERPAAAPPESNPPPLPVAPIPDLYTPVKLPDGFNMTHMTHMTCDTSSGFTWDGEIPRTPQINTETTTSSSPFPFLVSMTKGFPFLPAAESPSLAVPATPSIIDYGASSTSIDTPFVSFYKFPGLPQTPRLEALRQADLMSPGGSLSSTMISPTQVVLGRSTPYFVPSGERAKGPVHNMNATPEYVPDHHQPQIDVRRSSQEMEPLQLEESNDASDAATLLLRKAAAQAALDAAAASAINATTTITATTATTLTPKGSSVPATPVKSDETLEKILIGECQRLEDSPSIKLKQKFIDLFGEDTEDGNAADPPAEEAPPEPTTPKSTRKPRKRRTQSKERKAEDPAQESDGCARLQDYSKSPLFQQKERRKVNQSQESSQSDNEDIIQELILMAKKGGRRAPARDSRKLGGLKRKLLQDSRLSASMNEVPSSKIPLVRRNSLPLNRMQSPKRPETESSPVRPKSPPKKRRVRLESVDPSVAVPDVVPSPKNPAKPTPQVKRLAVRSSPLSKPSPVRSFTSFPAFPRKAITFRQSFGSREVKADSCKPSTDDLESSMAKIHGETAEEPEGIPPAAAADVAPNGAVEVPPSAIQPEACPQDGVLGLEEAGIVDKLELSLSSDSESEGIDQPEDKGNPPREEPRTELDQPKQIPSVDAERNAQMKDQSEEQQEIPTPAENSGHSVIRTAESNENPAQVPEGNPAVVAVVSDPAAEISRKAESPCAVPENADPHGTTEPLPKASGSNNPDQDRYFEYPEPVRIAKWLTETLSIKSPPVPVDPSVSKKKKPEETVRSKTSGINAERNKFQSYNLLLKSEPTPRVNTSVGNTSVASPPIALDQHKANKLVKRRVMSMLTRTSTISVLKS